MWEWIDCGCMELSCHVHPRAAGGGDAINTTIDSTLTPTTHPPHPNPNKQAAEAPCPPLGGPVAVGVGSRAHYEKDSVAQRAWYRTILMKGLHVLVSVLISGRIRDTQCGR